MSKPKRVSKSGRVADEATAKLHPIERSTARLARPDDTAAPSPARLLQLKLETVDLTQTKGDDGIRWAPGATVLLAGGVSALIWSAIALALGAHL